MTNRNISGSLSALGTCWVWFACAAFSSAVWAQAGYVHEISGEISIQRGSAKAAPAKAGDTFAADTVFHTGTDAKVVLKYADGQVVALGAESALRIGPYRYVANDARQSSSAMELIRGEMRVVTGLIGATNREGVHITAGNSTLDIRNPGGADFTVVVKPGAQEVGAAVVARGEISVRTPYGPIYKIDAGQYAPWQPGRTLPPPLPIAAAPAAVQAAVAGLWATVVPASGPVAVATAARTAAVVAAANTAQVVANADPKLAGYVDSVSSNVSIRAGTGKTVNAIVGRTFAAGTTFNTGTDGRAVLKFADGQVVVLGPNSTLGVDQYQFDPSNIKASKSAIDLVDGTMRFVSGVIHSDNHEGVSISAGTTLVDIKNTGAADFTVSVNTKNTKEQEVGVAAVALGEISVHTPYGPISKIEAGQAAPWQPGQATLPVVPLAAAPASVQAVVAALSAAARPENTPVVVQSAALAAVAVAAATSAQAAANADPGNTRLQAIAQATADQATTATQASTAASQAVAATVFSSTLATLPATAAGPAQAQIATAPPIAPPAAPITPTVTPGGGVLRTCTGSPC